MTRGWTRCLALSIVPLLSSLGCDALTVRSFAGTVSEFTLAGAAVTPPGQHLELWARDQYNDIIRLQPYYDLTNYKTAYGLMIRKAIPLDSPCMIDGSGNLLTDPAAYPTTLDVNGTTETPQEQAQAIVERINELNPLNPGPLLAVLPYDPNPEPVIPAGTSPADRKAACDAYIHANDSNPSLPPSYVPNPLQVTAPAHGTVYGFVAFNTLQPVADYDGYRLDMPVNLKGIQEVFFTTESATVDPKNRGPLYLISTLTGGGTDVVHFDLAPPPGSMGISGTAAMYVNLDQDPVQF
jgi:hypothetical protein